MKLFRWTAAAVLLSALAAACGNAPAPTAIPTVVLGSGSRTASGGVTASGTVVPVQHVALSFPMTGMVASVSVEVGDQVSTGNALARLDTTLLDAEVGVADADLQAEQIAYTYLARTGTDQEHLDAKLAEVARAQALLNVKQATVMQATLRSPLDATVASVDISPGETVVPGQVVLTLADLTRFEVETTDLSERDAPRVRAGQRAQVDVIALGEEIEGTVADVSRLASTIGGDVVYKVTIRLDTQPEGLLWGMSTTVRIAVEE